MLRDISSDSGEMADEDTEAAAWQSYLALYRNKFSQTRALLQGEYEAQLTRLKLIQQTIEKNNQQYIQQLESLRRLQVDPVSRQSIAHIDSLNQLLSHLSSQLRLYIYDIEVTKDRCSDAIELHKLTVSLRSCNRLLTVPNQAEKNAEIFKNESAKIKSWGDIAMRGIQLLAGLALIAAGIVTMIYAVPAVLNCLSAGLPSGYHVYAPMLALSLKTSLIPPLLAVGLGILAIAGGVKLCANSWGFFTKAGIAREARHQLADFAVKTHAPALRDYHPLERQIEGPRRSSL